MIFADRQKQLERRQVAEAKQLESKEMERKRKLKVAGKDTSAAVDGEEVGCSSQAEVRERLKFLFSTSGTGITIRVALSVDNNKY